MVAIFPIATFFQVRWNSELGSFANVAQLFCTYLPHQPAQLRSRMAGSFNNPMRMSHFPHLSRIGFLFSDSIFYDILKLSSCHEMIYLI